jgi:hypothetical protein
MSLLHAEAHVADYQWRLQGYLWGLSTGKLVNSTAILVTANETTCVHIGPWIKFLYLYRSDGN